MLKFIFILSILCVACLADKCEDRSTKCKEYIATGWYNSCQQPGTYLFDYCRRTCNLCKKPVPTLKPGCYDHEKNCAYWKKTNQCLSNPNFMKKYCTKTCGGCGGGTIAPTIPPGCNDYDDTKCKQSRCKYDRAYMSKYCRKTCQMCSATSTCFDKDSLCPEWKAQGNCKKDSQYHTYMLKNCPYSCTGC